MKAFFLILFSLTAAHLYAQVGNTVSYTWMKGDNTQNNYGVYGSLGVAAPTNKPGAREQGGMNWTDASGNLWQFGGYGYASVATGMLNDLWRYNPVTNEWTWISGDNTPNNTGVYGTKGTPSSGNKPGGRYLSATWTDNAGDLWLFGGYGYAASGSGELNDLWKYHIATNEWTWVSGDNTINNYGVYGTPGVGAPANKPGGRDRVCRTDAKADVFGNLWLFGGRGFAASTYGDLNDLWKYNIAAGEWTWVSGDNTAGVTGVYGTMGTAAAGNKPGARVGGVCWLDTAGKFWLCGGGNTSGNWSPKFSDLWKYDPVTGLWTWVKGNNTADNYGIYGTQGIAAAVNNPGGRLMAKCWIDNYGNLWLFGGYGFTASGQGNATGTQGLNDLWKYDPLTNNWTWMKGDYSADVVSVYGVQGVTAPSNKLGQRSGGNQWIDKYGNLWQFGGLEWDVPTGFKNDLWKIVIPQPVARGNLVSCEAMQTVTITAANSNTWVPVFDDIGKIAAEINANGNILGLVNTSLFTRNGACREDAAHRLYLNRNISITPQNQPAGNVSVRLFILQSELDSLRMAYNSQGQPSGVASINEIDVFKNNDACASIGSNSAFPVSATSGTYNSDYYLEVTIGGFSSFYFANKLLSTILPVSITSFTGKKNGASNLLNWSATCNAAVHFIIERSADGNHFNPIGTVPAADCNHTFQFTDPHPFAGNNYYRLKLTEASGSTKYSSIILLQDKQSANLVLTLQSATDNNSTLQVQVSTSHTGTVNFMLVDMTGRLLFTQQKDIPEGSSVVSLRLPRLAPGIYNIYCVSKNERSNAVRFINH